MEIPKRIVQLLQTISAQLLSIKTAAFIDRGLCDGIICSEYQSAYDGNNHERIYPKVLRVNPTQSILDIYKTVFLQDRSFHIEMTATSEQSRPQAHECNLFLNTLFDKIGAGMHLTEGTSTALKEGLSFLHYTIKPNGEPHLQTISPINSFWDASGRKISSQFHKTTSFFAFQELKPFSSIKILAGRGIKWRDIETQIPLFSSQVGGYRYNPNCDNIGQITQQNNLLSEDNKLGLLTYFYERAIIDDNKAAEALSTLYNDKELRIKYGSNGRKAVLKEYDWEVVNKQWKDLFKRYLQ